MICQTSKFNTEKTNRYTYQKLFYTDFISSECHYFSVLFNENWHLVYWINYPIENSMQNNYNQVPRVRLLSPFPASFFPKQIISTSTILWAFCKTLLSPLIFVHPNYPGIFLEFSALQFKLLWGLKLSTWALLKPLRRLARHLHIKRCKNKLNWILTSVIIIRILLSQCKQLFICHINSYSFF